MNMNLKQKKNDSNCNFYHGSLLIPYPSKFLVVCHCILIFHGTYLPPPTTNIFLYCGKLISFLGGVARPFSSIKPSMTNHVNSLLVDNFLFENFLYIQVSIQTLKKVFTIV